MPTERRIRRDFPNPELAMARVFRARKEYKCVWCLFGNEVDYLIAPNQVYARISGTRVEICSAHFQYSDIVVVENKGYLGGADVSRTSND